MKRLLSMFMSLVMIATAIFVLPLTAQAEEVKYNEDIINANNQKIVEFVKEYGVLNDSDYAFPLDLSEDDCTTYSMIVVDKNDEISFLFMETPNDNSAYIYGGMNVTPLSEDTMKIDIEYLSDLAYFSGFSTISRSTGEITYKLEETDLPDGVDPEALLSDFVGNLLSIWDFTLYRIFDLNLGAVGLHTYCVEHTAGEPDVTRVEPTCLTAGKVTTVTYCTICGATIDTSVEELPALNHKNTEKLEYCGPSCVDAGWTEGKICADCGETLVRQEKIAPLGHTYDSGKVTKKATTSADGVYTYSCTRKPCNAKKTEASPKIATIKLSSTAYTYDGKAKKPSVTITDSKGNAIPASNYTVSYASGRTKVGKYSVKITFKGKYSGTKTLSFTISPKSTSISKLTAGKKAFTVKWNKQTKEVSGYQIQYSTSSNFSNATTKTVSGSKNTSKKITGLKKNKRYYVRVRTYKTVGNTKYYSAWSKTKNVRTK